MRLQFAALRSEINTKFAVMRLDLQQHAADLKRYFELTADPEDDADAVPDP